jgi:hypothetical protein
LVHILTKVAEGEGGRQSPKKLPRFRGLVHILTKVAEGEGGRQSPKKLPRFRGLVHILTKVAEGEGGRQSPKKLPRFGGLVHILTKVAEGEGGKPLPGFFLCIFSSLTCLKKPVFSKGDLVWWKVPTFQAELGSSDQRKVPTSLSLFLKSEKIPGLLYGGKGPEYRLFHDFRPVPSVYWPWAQISNHRRVCTQAHLLYMIFT